MKLQQIRAFWLLIALLCLLSGCQATPKNEVVVNKNNSTFDANSIVSASKRNSEDLEQTYFIESEFTSSDGSVDFIFEIDQSIPICDMPVVEVRSHRLTSEDAKRVAQTLFPGCVFYEAEPARAENYSKSEIQSKINRWSSFTSEESLIELYQDIPNNKTVDVVKNFIEHYTTLYENAPENNPHTITQWTMRKSPEYQFPAEEIQGMDMSNENDEVSVQFSNNGIPYYFTVSTRDEDDFKVNRISLYIEDGLSPRNIDSRIFRARLCRTEEPTQQQIDDVRNKVEQILSSLNLGDWQIDECYVDHGFYDIQKEYVICVNAVPQFIDVSAIRRPQLYSLRNESGYAAEQYLTDVNFEFSANGDLISFSLYTPLDVKDVLSSNVQVISIQDLINKSMSLFELSDYYAYGYGDYLEYVEEELQCTVTISEINYGLSRIKVPNSDDSYYYVPSLALLGFTEYVGKESGTLFYESNGQEVLILINAVDGSIINETNE